MKTSGLATRTLFTFAACAATLSTPPAARAGSEGALTLQAAPAWTVFAAPPAAERRDAMDRVLPTHARAAYDRRVSDSFVRTSFVENAFAAPGPSVETGTATAPVQTRPAAAPETASPEAAPVAGWSVAAAPASASVASTPATAAWNRDGFLPTRAPLDPSRATARAAWTDASFGLDAPRSAAGPIADNFRAVTATTLSANVAAPVSAWVTPAARPTMQRAAFSTALTVHPDAPGPVVTVYTTPASYNSASGTNTTYAFSGAPAGGSTSVGTSYTQGPLTFGGSSLTLYNDGSYGQNVTYLEESQQSETITLAGARGLSFYLGGNGGTITIAVNGTTATTVAAPTSGSGTFTGFTDTVNITSLTFTSSNNEIDVISFQENAAVPEPATWLGGLGLCAAAGLTLRRRARGNA